MPEIIYIRGYDGIKVQEWPEHMPNDVGRFAMELIRQVGIAVAEVGAEDSSGRATFQVMPAAEIAARACDIAEQTFNEMEKRGMLQPILPYEAARDASRAEKERN